MNFKGFLQVYAEVSDYEQAFEIATKLLETLKPFVKIKTRQGRVKFLA